MLGPLIFIVIFLALTLPVMIYLKRKDKLSEAIHQRWETEVEEDSEEQLYLVEDKVTTEVPQDAFVFVKHRGVVLPMRIHEKATIWDKMNRAQRNEQVKATEKALREGKVVSAETPDETVLLVPRSKDLKKIQETYAEFVRLGGKPSEE